MRRNLAAAAGAECAGTAKREALQLHREELGRPEERQLLARALQAVALCAHVPIVAIQKLLLAEEAHGRVEAREAADLRLERAAQPRLQSGVAAVRARRLRALCEGCKLLSQPVERAAHELVRVLLPAEAKAARNVGKRGRDVARRVRGTLCPAGEGSVHQLLEAAAKAESVWLCRACPALCGVLPLLQVPVHCRGVNEALQDRVHEACVSEISEAPADVCACPARLR
eukprot:scaffold8457_cov112-Isochrysis_galbana.AAC.5